MKQAIKFSSILLLILLVYTCGYCQNAAPSTPALATPVPVDIDKHTIGDIPYDKPFFVTGAIPDGVTTIHKVEMWLRVGRDPSNPYVFISSSTAGPNATDGFRAKGIFVLTLLLGDMKARLGSNDDFLLPNHEYSLSIRVFNNDAANTLNTNYSFDYGFYPKVKIGDYAKIDFGLGYSPVPKALFGFTSVHFYLTPMNDETDLSEINTFRRNVFLRLSVFMGLAPLTISSDTKQPMKNEFATGNFIFGIGVRSPFYWPFTRSSNTNKNHRAAQSILQPMRLVFGEVLFKQTDKNSIIPKDRHKLAPYIGISYDLNIASILGPIGKILSQ